MYVELKISTSVIIRCSCRKNIIVYLHFCNNSFNELMQTHTEVSMKWAQYNTLLWFSKTPTNTCLCLTNWHQFNGNIIKNMTRNPKSMWFLFDSQHSHWWASNEPLPANWGKTQSSPITLGCSRLRGRIEMIYDVEWGVRHSLIGKREVRNWKWGRVGVMLELYWYGLLMDRKIFKALTKMSLNKKCRRDSI